MLMSQTNPLRTKQLCNEDIFFCIVKKHSHYRDGSENTTWRTDFRRQFAVSAVTYPHMMGIVTLDAPDHACSNNACDNAAADF